MEKKKTWNNINIRKICFLPSLPEQTRLLWVVEAADNSEDQRDISQKILRWFTAILERSGILFQIIFHYPPSFAHVVARDPKWSHLSQTGVQDSTASNTLSSKSVIGGLSPFHHHKYCSRRYISYLLIFLIYWRNSTIFDFFQSFVQLSALAVEIKEYLREKVPFILVLYNSKIMKVQPRNTIGKRKIQFNCFQGCISISFTMFEIFPVHP